MNKTTEEQWQKIFTSFCHDCFLYWKREGDSIAVAFDKAREETLKLRFHPLKQSREEVDLNALHRWNSLYSQHVVDLLYQNEQNDSLCDLRICHHCGFPVFDGYYAAGDFFCCPKCAVDGGYDGDKEQFEQDLKGADTDSNEVYWSQWESSIDD